MYCHGNNQSRVAIVLGYVHTIPITFRGVTKGYRHSMNGNAGPGRTSRSLTHQTYCADAVGREGFVY